MKSAKQLAEASLRVIAPMVNNIQNQAMLMRISVSGRKNVKYARGVVALDRTESDGDVASQGSNDDDDDNNEANSSEDDEDDSSSDEECASVDPLGADKPSDNGDTSGGLKTRSGSAGRSKTITAEATGSDLLAVLADEIVQQRRMLAPNEVDEFDSAWGIDPTGQFYRRSRRSYWSIADVSSEALLRKEVALVREEAEKKAEKLGWADDDHIGLELLHLFVLDLLGRDTNAAKIFNSKTGDIF